MATELAALNSAFARPGTVAFIDHPLGGIAAELATPAAVAAVALHGAHVLSFTPRGGAPVLWMSPAARIAPGQGIRGGIPVCWPWFAAHPEDPGKPDHGFVRKTPWRVLATQAHADTAAITLGFATAPEHAALWPGSASLELTVTLSDRLRVELATTNTGTAPVTITEALHTYFAVGDIRRTQVLGLDGVTYRDKLQDFARLAQHGPIAFAGEVDRIYEETSAGVVIDDAANARAIHIAKSGSLSTVVWNPWIEKSARLSDMPPGTYLGMVCVETTNAGGDVVTLPPRATHRLTAEVSLSLPAERLDPPRSI